MGTALHRSGAGRSADALPVRTPALQFLPRAANSQSFTRRAEVGRLLVEVRKHVPHGSFQSYVDGGIPFTSSTAERAMNLHRFALKETELFDQPAPLAHLPPARDPPARMQAGAP